MSSTSVESRLSGTTTPDDKEKVIRDLPVVPHLTQTGDDELHQTDVTSVDKRDIPLRYRLLAMSMILFFATGSSYAEGTLNAQYGTISSASSLVNTILPIIGGVGIDYWGAAYAAVISSVFVVLGAVISAAGTHGQHYGMLVGGRILMVIESTQGKLYAHWFAGSHLAFVFAIDIAWNRITGIIAKTSAVPMSEINGFWGWALWIPAIICFFNLALCVAYLFYERTVPKAYRPPLGKDAHDKEGTLKKRVTLNTLYALPKFFWILCGTQMFQNAAVATYTSNLADIQTRTRGTSKLAAGYNSSLQGVIPVVLTPLTGLFFDRFGYRMFFVSWTGMLYIIVFVLIGLTTVHPLAPIIISSFANATNAVTFTCAIPILVGDDRLLGTAFGVWKAFANANTLVLEVAAGAIQDRSSTDSYDNVIYLLIAIKALQVVWGPIYDYLDGRWVGHSLRRGELQRIEIRKQDLEQHKDSPGWRVSRVTMFVVGGQLTALIIVAWVVYIIYSLGT
ncbi:hypothetical protein CI109_103887 [Kwoniella shandongensis]|uniref:Lysosomal dipeptide transporter MFSD1 n=1 Tax=Kwoniella shandongensis TaxID=1734106 RepID=A0AAJ8LK85_9TREE